MKQPILVNTNKSITQFNTKDKVVLKAVFKATLNALILPLGLILLTKSIGSGLLWIIFVSVLYKYVIEGKRLNATYFFNALILELLLILIYALLIIGG